jgi:excisionase family DNA binding protein
MQTLAERKQKYMTIQEAADYLGVRYSYAYSLIIKCGSIPHIDHGNGGRLNPKYLVLRTEVKKYKRRKRPKGRPRTGDGPNKGFRRNRGIGYDMISFATVVQDYRKEHGHYPSMEEMALWQSQSK